MNRTPFAYKGFIYPTIVDIEYDNKYAVIKQQPNQLLHVNGLARDLYSRYVYCYKSINDSSFKKAHTSRLVGADSALYFAFKSKSVSLENSLSDNEASKLIADSVLKNSEEYQDVFRRKLNYWLIVGENIYGPMDKTEYLIKRRELNIPKKIFID